VVAGASAVNRRQRPARPARRRDGGGDGTAGRDEAPLRAELFSVGQLERHARKVAAWHRVAPAGRSEDRLLARLADNEVVFAEAYALLTEAVTLGRRVTPAAEWFVDNYHLIEEQIRTARRHLPRGYHRTLPRLVAAGGVGAPRVYDIALELISHSHGRVDVDGLRAFVASYQSVASLQLGELWAIPIMLRLALLENLRRVVVAVTAGRRDRETAQAWIDRMRDVAAGDPTRVVLVLADLVDDDPPLTSAFVAELAARLQGQGASLGFPMAWLEQRLADRGETVEHVFQLASQSQAADQVSVGNSIGSLRLLDAIDWRDFVEATSGVERVLRGDPSGVYPTMDFATRDRYRHVVEALSRQGGGAEDGVARAAVGLARSADGPQAAARTGHVGYYLIDRGRRELERALQLRTPVRTRLARGAARGRFPLYAGALLAITAAVVAAVTAVGATAGLPTWAAVGWCGLLAVAASQLAVAVVHWAATLLVQPQILPRLDFAAGIPDAERAMVAIPTMLTDEGEIDRLVEALEIRFLANRDRNLVFALIGDLRDGASETAAGDAALLAHARAGIEGLNQRYQAGGDAAFFLLCRPRRWNPSEGAWMGWERKRGKLEELNAALRGDAGGFSTVVGPSAAMRGIRSVIALDSDTELPRDAGRLLVATLAHPLNRPIFDARRGRVTAGHAILQPRVAVSLASTGSSQFARLFGGEPGIDPYTRAVSDVYQDLFGEGSFVGKGIYDVDVVQQAIGGRLPDNRVLSHDLLEGAYARAGLVSDVLLIEDYPSTFAADASRRARWVRGDWQIAGWLRRRVPTPGGRAPNPISRLSQWKILDNLRRSLVPVAQMALLVAGWTTPVGAVLATTVVGATLLLPGLLSAATALARRPSELPRTHHRREIASALALQVLRELLFLAWLPHAAWLGIQGLTRAGLRVLITRRRLLEWRTARDAQLAARGGLVGTYRAMAIGPLVAAAVGAAVVGQGATTIALAAPVLGLWLVGPAVAWWLSRPIVAARPALTAADVDFLRVLSRRTWRFFETHVGAEDNHLPPDNVQEDPPQGVAHRTSPTNIGLALTANLAAHDFGYLTAGELVERTTLTLAAMDRLERYRGHFYNWYDTRTLEPLRPTYVSTVDSGNLAGHLVTLAAGLRELGGRPIIPDQVLVGLGDTLDVLAGVPVDDDAVDRGAGSARGAIATRRGLLMAPLRTTSAAAGRLAAIAMAGRELARALAGASAEAAWWSRAFAGQAERALAELEWLAPWLVSEPPGGAGNGSMSEIRTQLDALLPVSAVAGLDRALAPAFAAAGARADGLRAAVALGAERAAARLAAHDALAARCTRFADLDVEFLYDRERHLLAIGFNVADHRLDASYYDLLASEARLASFVAIAQGKLPQEHWFRLGRLLTASAGRPALLSWSGSMFEYLMPLLVMPTYPRTMLDETYRAVVARQIGYGRERGVPWGVSESGYNKTDAHLNYQYRAFGVPGLGFKRGLAEDLVIAPYASAMALMVDPVAACANLRRLARDGRQGVLGFYEAIDYTAARVLPGADSATVKSYMAHHQGMAFLSLAYLLLDRPMQRRFDAEPSYRATELLLQERVPRTPYLYPHPAEVSQVDSAPAESALRVITTPSTPAPEVHLLSNGQYHVMVSNAGGGYSRWRDLAVTRWHEDTTRDAWGSFGYLRDVVSGAVWSTAHQPTLRRADHYEAIFSPGRAEFRRRDGDLETHVEISVSPEDDVELRRVTITNRGRAARTIELTTYAEVVLTQPAADAAHPAFSNLFVETELLAARRAILCTRRPRSKGEQPPWLLHLVTVQGPVAAEPSYETGRAAFIGRGRTAADPAAMHQPTLGGGAGAVLDPIVAIRNTVTIEPDGAASFHLVTGMADSRDVALGLVEKYGDRHAAARVFELSWTHSQVALRRLDASDADIHRYERLAASILYTSAHLRAPATVIARNKRGQSGLWAYGISGDLPIALVQIGDLAHVELVRQLVKAHAYWRSKGLAVDLVIWNEDPSIYRQALHEQIMAVIAAMTEVNLVDKPGGIFVRRSEHMSDDDKLLLLTVARLVVSGGAGSLAEQMDHDAQHPPAVPRLVRPARRAEVVAKPVAAARADLVAYNGLGGFTRDGREYVITTGAGHRTPAPWVNVLANPWFGTVVSESGGAYTWCENAHGYRLTPWHNDPVSDASGEASYLRDEDDGRFWSPTPLPAGDGRPYTSRHGFGYSAFEHTSKSGIESELRVLVATDAPVKLLLLTVRNRSGRPRRLSWTASFDLVLGTHRAANAPHVVTEVDVKTGALLARNAYHHELGARVAFLTTSEHDRTVSADRGDVVGRNRGPGDPLCMHRTRLSGRVGAGLDPCLAMQIGIDLADGQEREVVLAFGSGRDLDDARDLVQRFRTVGAAHAALEGVWSYWKRTLGAVHVQTPDPTLDFLANGWLLYQVLASRMWGRSGFYQSGGAFGFRDQLQDSMSLVHAEPALLREQIVRAAGRQFREGDVQHWWHPPVGRGVRTRISDDYLWLPYAVCHYVAALGDTGVLDEPVGFLAGRAVKPDEDSVYDLPERADEVASIYQHCVRAIQNGLHFGDHGLPLMGTGDWNDGMNLVGEGGRGESVWLAFFLHDVLVRFGALATSRGDSTFAASCADHAAGLRARIEEHGWDGGWYRRAYFDDGAPLGSAESPECQIDSLPQSWAALTGAVAPERIRTALDAADRRLVRRDRKLIQLFDPPFDRSALDPGYVKGYVPGVRENGGQYTHAAVWMVMAFAAVGDRVRAWELFDLINPVRHGDDAAAIATYKVEPYVAAADVYMNPQHAGRGGWTWYTGSAGWMYRLITESLLGLRLELDRLHVAPLLPASWPGYQVHYRYRETVHHIQVRQRAGGGATRVVVDGVAQAEAWIQLRDDGRDHQVEVEVATP
jgi:cyclic beta-1,2-glucan synthetase